MDVEKLKEFVHSLSTDIYTLTGSRQVIFSQKRNRNTSSLLFNKYGFAQVSISLLSQKCGATNCSSCGLKLPNNNTIQILPQFCLKPSSMANCKTDNIIYAALCKLCDNFYFGKSINEEHNRMNGHRNKTSLPRKIMINLLWLCTPSLIILGMLATIKRTGLRILTW